MSEPHEGFVAAYLADSVATMTAFAADPATARTLLAMSAAVAGAMRAGRKLLVQHHAAVVKASVTTILHKTNIETFESQGTDEAKLNDIVRVRLKTAGPLVADEYRQNRVTGAFILVDEQTGATLAAGLIAATDPDYFTQEVPAEPAFSI